MKRSGQSPRSSFSNEDAPPPSGNPWGASLVAVQFAAKLKQQVKKSAAGPTWQERKKASFLATHGDRDHGPRSARNSREELEPVQARSPRSPRGESWTQLRKDAYLRKYGFAREQPVTQPDVAVSALSFVAKLKNKTKTKLEAEAAEKASSAPTRSASQSPRDQMTWTQKRKEAYLRKYGKARLEAAAPTDVAVTAVVFASRLQKRATAAKGEPPATATPDRAGAFGSVELA